MTKEMFRVCVEGKYREGRCNLNKAFAHGQCTDQECQPIYCTWLLLHKIHLQTSPTVKKALSAPRPSRLPPSIWSVPTVAGRRGTVAPRPSSTIRRWPVRSRWHLSPRRPATEERLDLSRGPATTTKCVITVAGRRSAVPTGRSSLMAIVSLATARRSAWKRPTPTDGMPTTVPNISNVSMVSSFRA